MSFGVLVVNFSHNRLFSVNQLINRILYYILGAAMRSKTNFSNDTLQFAPFTLLPSAFPKSEFQRVVSLQTVFNELIHTIAHDRQFLTETLKR